MDNIFEIVGNQVFFVELYTANGLKQAVVQMEDCGNVVTNIVPVYEHATLEGVFIFVAGDCKPVQPLPGTSNRS